MDTLLDKYNDHDVPYISPKELLNTQKEVLILDTRKKEEFLVSHIPNAVWADEDVNKKAFAKAHPNKSQPIVVYCSVGVRSENFGKTLLDLGYTNVKNVYGSIFAWKDAGYEVINSKGKSTDSVHVYSKEWSKYLKTGIKVY